MKTLFQKIDKPLFFLSLIYTILGLVMVLSASSVSAVLRYNVSSSYFFVRQLLFMGAAWFVGLFFFLELLQVVLKVG